MYLGTEIVLVPGRVFWLAHFFILDLFHGPTITTGTASRDPRHNATRVPQVTYEARKRKSEASSSSLRPTISYS